MTTEITRRRHHGDGITSETVHSWHFRKEGPGEPGGRTYQMLYADDGRVRIDVTDQAGSTCRAFFLGTSQIRPRQEWLDHLRETRQEVVEPRWCTVDGVEIPDDSDPEFDDNCCSAECRADLRPDW